MRGFLLLSVLTSVGPCLNSTSAAPPAQDPALAGELEPGDYAVGFRRETLELPTRPGAPSAADLFLWYPASSDPAVEKRMRLEDYYRAQRESDITTEELREWLRSDMTSPPDVTASVLDSLLASPMWARVDAAFGDETYPLVLWSFRDSVPTMQTLLNEYLASHGYVVAFAWPKDQVPPFPWEDGLTRSDKLEALNAQTTMLEDVLDALTGRPFLDRRRVSVLAWSYGGESASALQTRRRDVVLVIGVDATIVSGWVYRPGAESTLDADNLAAPYVSIRNGRPRLDAAPSSEPSMLARARAGSWFVRFPALSHGNFNFPGGMIPGVLGLEEVSDWAVGGEAARLGYELICRHVLGILDAYQRGGGADPSAWSEPAPAGFVEAVHHPPR